ncbi:MAG: acyl-CoA mutase large subunit family protein [Alphaproteobacteria bacterium]|nr:acyl-CoA mutase large subunit family protein [Alphaproteobacteria bacterium]MDP6815807.1 acyl-CoA mutase large subunit family protein [Alphaproteobacteria bacterium]
MFDKDIIARAERDERDWRQRYDRIVERFGEAAPKRAKGPSTRSGLPLKSAYFPSDLDDIDYRRIGAPGGYPYTRGNLAAQYQMMNWANQPVIGFGLPEDTRARMDALSQQGMTGYFGQNFYNLLYDLVSHEGLDPDDPAARGRVGQCGMAVYSVADMARLFDGLDLAKINVVHITDYQVVPALAQYIAYGRRRGVPAEALRGNTMNYYHQSAFCGMSAFPPEQGHKLAVALIAYCARHMPQWNTTNFVGYDLEETGGNAVQEAGMMLAYGIELVRSCIEAGVAPDLALSRFGFQIAQGNDFFEEIAKIRALRQIWATTMQERFGVSDPRAMHVRIHTHTAGATLTAEQPLVNLIRTTLQAFGAALSGVQAMEVAAYDEAYAIPTEEAATLTLRIQQVIQEETNITSVSDPLAGSYFMEKLTDQMARAATDLAEEIERMGGYIAAQRQGWIRTQIENSAEQWRDQVDSGESRLVGVNCYQSDDHREPDLFTVDERVERIAIERIRAHRQERDAGKFEAAMAEFRAAVGLFAEQPMAGVGDDRLMEAAIAAAEADATTGEMMAAMKAALGWDAPYNFAA